VRENSNIWKITVIFNSISIKKNLGFWTRKIAARLEKFSCNPKKNTFVILIKKTLPALNWKPFKDTINWLKINCKILNCNESQVELHPQQESQRKKKRGIKYMQFTFVTLTTLMNSFESLIRFARSRILRMSLDFFFCLSCFL